MNYYWIKFIVWHKQNLYKNFDEIATTVNPYLWLKHRNEEQDDLIFELMDWKKITKEEYCNSPYKQEIKCG